MAVRVGVDVGGTFTKAVACDAASGFVLAKSVAPTTHGSSIGLAEGVLLVLADVFDHVERLGAGPVLLVAHSTTQAVNALLEGDTAAVGVLGLGHRPDLRKARKRTSIGSVRLAPGRELQAVHGFLDATDGLTPEMAREAVDDLRRRGAEVVCVSEAYGVEDPSTELLALKAAEDLEIHGCAGHELSGLYGLELRTVTAALNASILPAALATARVVEEALAARLPGMPLLVMRGDGGAADMRTMRRRPLLTAFSGPAASVAGALRHLWLRDGLVVEVGGTSTNVSVVRGGRPVLSYIRVLDHVTYVRSLDVRVVGVAGGSLLRVGRRLGRLRVLDVGPRSAHIAGLPYCSFASPGEMEGADADLVAPRPGDPRDYAVVRTPSGRRYALTLTCAANALGEVPTGAHALGSTEAARIGFQALARLVGGSWEAVAREALRLGVRKVAEVAAEAAEEHGLRQAELVGLGGGSGVLVPALAAAMGVRWSIPPDAEVISSIGDALSLVRVEVERGVAKPSAEVLSALVREAEEGAVAAGAAPASLHVETEAVPDRGAVRVVAMGSAGLEVAEATLEAPPGDDALRAAAGATLGEDPDLLLRNDFYAVFASRDGARRRFAVIDRRGTVAATGEGAVFSGSGEEVAEALTERIPGMVRRLGPLAVAPAVRLVRGARLIDLTLFSAPDALLQAASAECALANGDPVVALVSRT